MAARPGGLNTNVLIIYVELITIAVRKIWCLPYNSHREVIYGVSNCKSLHATLLIRFFKMYDVMLNSENNIVGYTAHTDKDD